MLGSDPGVEVKYNPAHKIRYGIQTYIFTKEHGKKEEITCPGGQSQFDNRSEQNLTELESPFSCNNNKHTDGRTDGHSDGRTDH